MCMQTVLLASVHADCFACLCVYVGVVLTA